jgi:hypothetical protein
MYTRGVGVNLANGNAQLFINGTFDNAETIHHPVTQPSPLTAPIVETQSRRRRPPADTPPPNRNIAETSQCPNARLACWTGVKCPRPTMHTWTVPCRTPALRLRGKRNTPWFSFSFRTILLLERFYGASRCASILGSHAVCRATCKSPGGASGRESWTVYSGDGLAGSD